MLNNGNYKNAQGGGGNRDKEGKTDGRGRKGNGDGAGAGRFSGAVIVGVCWPADNGRRPAAPRRSRIVNPSSGYRATSISMRRTDVVSPAAERGGGSSLVRQRTAGTTARTLECDDSVHTVYMYVRRGDNDDGALRHIRVVAKTDMQCVSE